MTVGEEDQAEKSGTGSKKSRLNFGSFAVIVMSLAIGVTGIGLNVSKFRAEEPNLETRLVRVSVERGDLGPRVYAMVADLESDFGSVTGSRLVRLRQLAENISHDPGIDEIRIFERQLQEEIVFFSADLQSWKAEEIRYSDGQVIWPEGTSVNLLEPSVDDLFPADVLDAVRSSSDEIDPERISQVQHYAWLLYNISGEGRIASRAKLAKRLREIRVSFFDLQDSRPVELSFEVAVQNRSRLPNYLTSGLARVSDGGEERDVVLELEGDGLIEGYSFERFTFGAKYDFANDSSLRGAGWRWLNEKTWEIALSDVYSKIWIVETGDVDSDAELAKALDGASLH